MHITSTANPRIKELRKLSKRKTRHARGQLLLEGLRLVRDALDSGVTPALLLYVPDSLSADELQPLLATARARGSDVWTCTAAVFAGIAETVTPQGIAAVVPLPDLPVPATADFVLLLDGVRDPGNAGTLLRTAEAAGVDIVLFGPDSVDPFNDKVLRAAMGAHFRLPLRICPTWDAVRTAAPPGLAWYHAEASAAQAYDQVDWTQPAALIIGSEATGPSAAARAHSRAVAIPMHGHTESLNAAMAGAVILFEAARQRRVRKSRLR